jgi:hypothetical protein
MGSCVLKSCVDESELLEKSVCRENTRPDLSKEVRLALAARMNHARHPTRPPSAKVWVAR